MLQQPETSGRLLKWNIELSQFDLNFQTRRSIRGQVLVGFIAECTIPEDDTISKEVDSPRLLLDPSAWKLFTDGAKNDRWSGAGVVLETPEQRPIYYALRLEFRATNNDPEYEALIAGLKLAKELKITKLDIFCDTKIVVNQVIEKF